MTLSICIATYNRNKLLEKLLTSLVGQELPGNCTLEIIIVDNNPQAAAREVVNNFSSNNNFKFLYFVQKEKNISLTRNVAVKNATGDYVLFIDDDEFASDNWVMNLYNTLIKFDADGVFGTVTSYFPENTPDWIKNCFIYNRPTFSTGSLATVTRSGNCIIKSSLIKSVEGPFDPAFGITGGSDTMLFGLLLKKGAKFVNCFEAETFEFVPSQRSTLNWLIKRAFRTGNGFARRKIELNSRYKFLFKLRLILVGLSFSLISLVLVLILFPFKSKRVHWFLKFIANTGKISAVIGHFTLEYSQ